MNINRLPKFESKLDLSKVCKLANELSALHLERAWEDEQEFWDAWDKRAAEIAELERMHAAD